MLVILWYLISHPKLDGVWQHVLWSTSNNKSGFRLTTKLTTNITDFTHHSLFLQISLLIFYSGFFILLQGSQFTVHQFPIIPIGSVCLSSFIKKKNKKKDLDRLGASQVALVVKNPPANAGDRRQNFPIPGSGRIPEGGHGNPFQYSCLDNSRDRAAWQVMVHRVPKSRIWLKQLSMHACWIGQMFLRFFLRYSWFTILC